MNKPTIIIGIAAAAALLLLKAKTPEDAQDMPNYEDASALDQIGAIVNDVLDQPTESEAVQQQNINAFLWMIRVSEGTANADGYQTLVGGGHFDSMADHPRILVDLPNLGIKSSAAGAYQILRRTWDGLKNKLGLPDFSPTSQDAAAIELISQRGALGDVKAGRFASAVNKCRKEWASLPGAGYGQHENSLNRLQLAYQQAGGNLA